MRFQERADEFEDLLGVAAGLDLVEPATDAQVGVEDEGRSMRNTVADHSEVPPPAGTFGIRQSTEGQAVLIGKRPMRLDRIDADPDYHAIQGAELFVQVAEFLALDGAPGGIVGGMKKNSTWWRPRKSSSLNSSPC